MNSDCEGASCLDRLIETQVAALLLAADRLRAAAARTRRTCAGTPEHPQACRIARAAEAVFASPALRPLLEARTAGELARDQAVSDATSQELARAAARGHLATVLD